MVLLSSRLKGGDLHLINYVLETGETLYGEANMEACEEQKQQLGEARRLNQSREDGSADRAREVVSPNSESFRNLGGQWLPPPPSVICIVTLSGASGKSECA